MKINNITYKSPLKIKQNFKSTNVRKYRTSLDEYKAGEIGKIADIIGKQYTDSKHTKIYDLGCSDGTFSYALAINLMEKLQENAEKFFPIIASDKDKTIIDYAKNRYITLKPLDQALIKNNAYGKGSGSEEYLEYINTNLYQRSIKKECNEKGLSYDEIMAKRINQREECKSRFLDGEFFMDVQKYDYFGNYHRKKNTNKDELLEYYEPFNIKPILAEKVDFIQKDIIDSTQEILEEKEKNVTLIKNELQNWIKNNQVEFDEKDLESILRHCPKDKLDYLANKSEYNYSSSNQNINTKEFSEWLKMYLEDKGISLTHWLSSQMINLIADSVEKENKVIIFKNILESSSFSSFDMREKQEKIIENILKSLNDGDILILGDDECEKIIGDGINKMFKKLAKNVYAFSEAAPE